MNNQTLYTMSKHCPTFSNDFDFVDSKGGVYIMATEESHQGLLTVTLTDCNKDVWLSITRNGSKVQILDAKNNLVGTGNDTDYPNGMQNIELKDLKGNVVASAKIANITLYIKDWLINIADNSSVIGDSRVISALVATKIMRLKIMDSCTGFMYFGVAFIVLFSTLCIATFICITVYRKKSSPYEVVVNS